MSRQLITADAVNFDTRERFELRPGQVVTGLRLCEITIRLSPDDLRDDELMDWIARLACRRALGDADPITIEVV